MNRNPFNRGAYSRFLPLYHDTSKIKRVAVAQTQAASQRLAVEAQGRKADTPVAFPKHLFAPEDAQTIDIRRVCVVDPSSSLTLLTFTAPEGGSVYFTHYGLFDDGLDADLIEIRPTIAGSRIFPFHGDPQSNFKMNLGLAPDLSDNSMIPANLFMRAGDTVTWLGINNSLVAVEMGVRMRGYFDTTTQTVAARFGG